MGKGILVIHVENNNSTRVLRGKFIAFNAYICKQEKMKLLGKQKGSSVHNPAIKDEGEENA